MTKQEFETAACSTVNNEDFEVINLVYTFHPSISNTKGKEEIASLYTTFGMRIILDMKATALIAQNIEILIMSKKAELEELTEELKCLSK